MSSLAAPRCRHIKVNGTQCGSPALRNKNFCFYHQDNRPLKIECYSDREYATGEIRLPFFEDAHSIQAVIREVVQMVLQKRIERKTASLLLYALQIASSNLKRMELEKPQPEQVVIDVEKEQEWQVPIAARDQDGETVRESSASESSASESSANAPPANHNREASRVDASTPTNEDSKRAGEDLPPGTIQACYQPAPQMRNRPRQNHQRKRQYVI